jgi:tyrosinase
MSWHRPYLALYEQVLAKHVQTIAKGYNSATYQRAADRFRIPYWDWAAPPYKMPDWFSSSTIRINKPSGAVDVTNPLASYRYQRFPYISSTFPSSIPLSKFPKTVRRPKNGNSDPAAVNSLLVSQAPGVAQQLYTVFSRATAYNNMATQSSAGPSFEGPHGWLHVTVGGDGHMTDVGYAGFDPIFWLHHTNVDRLGVMWQAIYPNSYLQPAKEGGGSWTLVPGQTLNVNTPLLPFHAKDGKTAWTPTTARYAKSFGYAYPDVKDWLFTGTGGPAKLTASVTARVNQLYNLRAKSTKKRAAAMRGSLEARAGVPREWTIDISAPNAALGGISYTLLIFVGPKPAKPVDWFVASAGAMYVLAQPMSPLSGPMIAHTEVIVTEAMEDAGIDTTDVVASKAFLDKNLTWGVQKADGTVVPNDQFPGLTILVEDDIVKLPTSDTQLPRYSDKTLHPDITPDIPLK